MRLLGAGYYTSRRTREGVDGIRYFYFSFPSLFLLSTVSWDKTIYLRYSKKTMRITESTLFFMPWYLAEIALAHTIGTLGYSMPTPPYIASLLFFHPQYLHTASLPFIHLLPKSTSYPTIHPPICDSAVRPA